METLPLVQTHNTGYRYEELPKQIPSWGLTKKGKPDMRLKSNREKLGRRNIDGSLDKRFRDNKTPSKSASKENKVEEKKTLNPQETVPLKKEGTPDRHSQRSSGSSGDSSGSSSYALAGYSSPKQIPSLGLTKKGKPDMRLKSNREKLGHRNIDGSLDKRFRDNKTPSKSSLKENKVEEKETLNPQQTVLLKEDGTVIASLNRLDTQRICKVVNHQNNKRLPQPSTIKPLVFRLLNARSMRNKTSPIRDLVVEQDIDCLAITETWLRSDDADVINKVCPTGYDFYHVTRGSKGGGVALLFKKGLPFERNSSIKRQFKSFEFTDLIMQRSSSALRIVIVYRPPPSKNNKCTVTMFFNEFPLLLENLATTAGPILLAGDFNFKVGNNQDRTATRFTRLLNAFNLKQNISSPTHNSGSILDLIITRADENIASQFIICYPELSDHYMVGCTLTLTKAN